MEQIAVIGAGTMGNGIAHVFAQNGYKVNLVDISQASLDKGMATITKNLDRMISKEVIDGAKKEATLSNITTYTNLKEGVSDSDLVVEAATENLDIKLKIFKDGGYRFKKAIVEGRSPNSYQTVEITLSRALRGNLTQ